MGAVLGSGAHRYEVQDGWAKLPPEQDFNADVAAVGVDAQDRVYAFNRGRHPMVVLDRDGRFLRSWGEGVFHRPHGLHMAPDGTVWLTDDGDHTVRHCTLEGKVLATIGVPGAPRPYLSGGSTSTRRTGGCSSRGGARAPIPASSTSPTTSAATPTAGCTWPTGRITACRCSTATAATRRSG
jgi:hypothetical protein